MNGLTAAGCGVPGSVDITGIDNGSSDGTGRLAAEAGAHVVVEPRQGYGYACAAGAEADVLITADAATMNRATADGSVRGTPVVIATNALVLATAPGNPGHVTGLADLARPDLLVGLCSADVPCGALALQALDDAQVAPSIDTLELNVRALATKLSLGELDAGLIYTTDAVVADLPVVNASELQGHANRYYIASVSAEPAPKVQAVIDDFTGLGSAGAKALYTHGFGRP